VSDGGRRDDAGGHIRNFDSLHLIESQANIDRQRKNFDEFIRIE